jgi:hypothetical protein
MMLFANLKLTISTAEFEVFKKIAPGPALELTSGASKKHGHGTFGNLGHGLGSGSSNVVRAKAGKRDTNNSTAAMLSLQAIMAMMQTFTLRRPMHRPTQSGPGPTTQRTRLLSRGTS